MLKDFQLTAQTSGRSGKCMQQEKKGWIAPRVRMRTACYGSHTRTIPRAQTLNPKFETLNR